MIKIKNTSLGFEAVKATIRIIFLMSIVATSIGSLYADENSPETIIYRLEQRFDNWQKNSDGNFSHGYIMDNEDVCQKQIEALTKLKAPESLKFKISHDIPEVKAGEYSWAKEGRKACTAIVNILNRSKFIEDFKRWAGIVKTELADGGARHDDYFQNCINAYDEAIKAGISPTERIDGFTNTMKEIRDQLCAPGLAKLNNAEEERAAPYKKVLKNDKLKLALRDTNYWMLPGVQNVTPAKLAAAKVWFQEAKQEKYCANGSKNIYSVYRFEFNAKHKLVKGTLHEGTVRAYCGKPPASAFR